jgi:signal transduction histidine kinase
LDASKELNAKGVGLGLHISQRISEQFGGKIVVESEFGQGSTFIFLFDLEQYRIGENTVKRIMNPV